MFAFFFLAAAVPFLYRADTVAPSAQPSDEKPEHLRKRSSLGALGWPAVFALIALLVYSPWMLRNYFWTGNPVYPMAQAIFAHDGPADPHAHGNATTDAGGSQAPVFLLARPSSTAALTATVTVATLNVREGPGTDFPSVGGLRAGEEVHPVWLLVSAILDKPAIVAVEAVLTGAAVHARSPAPLVGPV